ncbi:hypothetical protein [Streptomyces sp. NPDC004286]|uniref:hypothetical protein n=1 Tax=Streptomyces sp. NPDC004286 TaxID=3364696 RepID=UPI003684CA4D
MDTAHRIHGCAGTAAALALALSTAFLLGRWSTSCDLGVNNAANSIFLLWLFIPGLWAVLLLAWVAVGTVLGNHPLLHALALALTLLALSWCAVSIFLDDAPTPTCPSGTPPWWPSHFPALGF